MNFILPRYFADVITNLRAIFKVKADKHLSLLSRDRVSRAKRMMTPFVLRRRKDMVICPYMSLFPWMLNRACRF